MIKKLLEGHECEEAQDGLIAVQKVKDVIDSNIHYDAIFMDFVMPNMNGPDATRAIRKLGYTGPILGVTGNSVEADKNIFKDAGATVVLIKPFKMAMLSGIIDL